MSLDELKKTHYVFPLARWELESFPHQGYILDIGGGGEGVIGQLMGSDVVAIDYQEEELLEAAEGPLKIIMDARDLQFLDGAFQTVTAFFSLMYLKSREDQQQVFLEISRVMKPGGIFHLWDIDLGDRPDTEHEIFIVHLEYVIDGEAHRTGYGSRWPGDARSLDYYQALAKEAGLDTLESERAGETFYLKLAKS